MDKTLGQIAHGASHLGGWARNWEVIGPDKQAEWERFAAAVAAAVKEEDARICRDFGATLETDVGDCFAEEIRASIKEVKL